MERMNGFDDAVWKGLKRLALAVLALLSLACAPGGSDSPNARTVGSPDPTPLAPESVVVTLKSGSGFTCFVLDSDLFCRASGASPNLGSIPAAFARYASISGGVTHFEVWDDTICISGLVSQRPQSNSAGQATYCFGEASLGPSYSGYPLVYSGPVFSNATHGSAEVVFHVEQPFVGGDVGMALFTNEGGMWGVMTDGTASVTTDSEDCELSETSLVCETFSVGL